MYSSINPFIHLSWIWPPPRIPVTTRIMKHFCFDRGSQPKPTHFPLESWEGATPNTYQSIYLPILPTHLPHLIPPLKVCLNLFSTYPIGSITSLKHTDTCIYIYKYIHTYSYIYIYVLTNPHMILILLHLFQHTEKYIRQLNCFPLSKK